MNIKILETLSYQDISYNIIHIDSCVSVGTELHKKGGNWHIHVLPPGCEYNPFDSLFSMVIEDDDNQMVYLAKSDVFPEADKVLVTLLHGEHITDVVNGSELTSTLADEPIIAFVMDLEKKGEKWHHHMHFPLCQINPEPGKWTIHIESASGGYSATFAEEPIDVLGVIESIFFSSLNEQ